MYTDGVCECCMCAYCSVVYTCDDSIIVCPCERDHCIMILLVIELHYLYSGCIFIRCQFL